MNIDPTIFKAYDVRGVYPSQINEEVVHDIVCAYCSFIKPKSVVLARDRRVSGPSLWETAKESFIDSGVEVIDIGIANADMYYLAVGTLDVDGGIFISASHNPDIWNGMNFCKRGAKPMSLETGLKDIQALAQKKIRVPSEKKGGFSRKDILDAYARFVLSFISPKSITPIRLVAQGNFSIAVPTLSHIIERGKLPITLIPLNETPIETFLTGDPNPLLLTNRKEISQSVLLHNADMGVAWDSDGDRCFFVDEKGNFIEGYFITALLASRLLEKHGGGKVVIDPRLTWATEEAIKNAGGTAVLSKPGMTVIAEKMEQEKALFGGEMSSHFYFQENNYRDNSMIPFLLVCEMMSREHKTLSELVSPYMAKYFISGERNFKVREANTLLSSLETMYQAGTISRFEGVSVEFPQWRFNIRASNTEPLVRLNIEALSEHIMKEKTEELSRYINKFTI